MAKSRLRLSVTCVEDCLRKAHDVNTGECIINTLNGEVRLKYVRGISAKIQKKFAFCESQITLPS